MPALPATSSPLVNHFKLDAFGLDGPSEASVAAVNAEFELLLELCPGKEGCQAMVSCSFYRGWGHLLPVSHQESLCS